jgi:hypothetical protein
MKISHVSQITRQIFYYKIILHYAAYNSNSLQNFRTTFRTHSQESTNPRTKNPRRTHISSNSRRKPQITQADSSFSQLFMCSFQGPFLPLTAKDKQSLMKQWAQRGNGRCCAVLQKYIYRVMLFLWNSHNATSGVSV